MSLLIIQQIQVLYKYCDQYQKAQSTEKCTMPISLTLRNSVFKQTVWTSSWLWCHNYTVEAEKRNCVRCTQTLKSSIF